MIRLSGVSFRYGKAAVLSDVSVELPRGKFTALIGPNGAGKSTLLALAARLLTPRSGSVHVDGSDLAATPEREIARRLAVLRQDNHVSARLTVVDLVRLGRFPHSRGRLRVDDHAVVQDALTRLQLDDLADRYLDQLSGGQRQRAFIAMVLAQQTDHLLLDEPLNNLDPRHSSDILRLLRRVCDDLGRTVVVVLHDLAAAAVFADQVVAMRDGRIAAAGPVHEVMTADVLSRVFDVAVRVDDRGPTRQISYLHREAV